MHIGHDHYVYKQLETHDILIRFLIGILLPGGSHVSGTICTLVVVPGLSVFIIIYFNFTYLQLHPTDWKIKCDELNSDESIYI